MKAGFIMLAAPDSLQPDWYIVAATKAGSPGQKPRTHDHIVIQPNATCADLSSLGNDYLKVYRKKFGVPRPGQRLGIRLIHFTSRLDTAMWSADITVDG